MDVEKLEKWVKENPDAADAPTINITTNQEFTIRGVLEDLKREKAGEAVMIDKGVQEVRKQVEDWMEEMGV